jgi:hypothetical protein
MSAMPYLEQATLPGDEATSTEKTETHPLPGSGSYGHVNGRSLAARVSILEAASLETRDRLARIETRLDATATREDLANLKTELKGDMAELKTELRSEMSILEARLTGHITDLSTGMAGLKAEMYQAINAQTWKLAGCAAALVAATWFIAARFH